MLGQNRFQSFPVCSPLLKLARILDFKKFFHVHYVFTIENFHFSTLFAFQGGPEPVSEFNHEKFAWYQTDSYSLRKRNAEKCKNHQNKLRVRMLIERQSFTTQHAYVTWVKTIKLTFFKIFTLNYISIIIIINLYKKLIPLSYIMLMLLKK